MNTIYIDKLKVTTKDGDIFYGVQFTDGLNDTHIYIDYKMITSVKLKELVDGPLKCKIETLSSDKVLISDHNLFTNGRNGTIGSINLKLNSYSGPGFGGHFADDDTISYKLCLSFIRTISSDIKVYKLNNVKIPFCA